MGGTSCDVCVVEDGARRPDRARARSAAGPIQLPMVDVHTVGAGGGSIGWRDPGGALRVGPRSAGAEPGPACYGRGGTEPTVTDANLLLGYLDSDSELAGGVDARPRGRRAPRSPASADELGLEPSWRPPRASSGSPTRRWCGRCAWSRSSAASTRAGSRCCRSAAPGRCTRPRSPSELGIERDPLPAGRRRALGARAGRLGATPRHRPDRDALAARSSTASAIAARGRARCARRSARASRARDRGRLRAALPRPGLRAAGRRPAERPTRRARRARSPPSTSAATATATPTPRSSWSTSASPLVEPGPSRGRRPRRRRSSSGRAAGRGSAASGSRPRCCAASRRRACAPRARASSSCPRRRSSCRPAGAPRSTRPARSSRAAGAVSDERASTRSRSRC